ncbi:MAG: phage scaffolding protein [Eubacteriales bacterium]|nr:phage scaffolding protein [Eubacteriales bacterium]
MDVTILKGVLSEETFAKVQDETSKVEGKLADLSTGKFVSNEKYSALETQLTNTQNLLNQKNDDYDKLKKLAGENDTLKKQIDDMKSDFETQKTELENNYKKQLKQNVISSTIVSEFKPKDVNDIMSHIDLEKIKVEDGKVTEGLKEQVEELRKEKAYYFDNDGGKGWGLDHNGETKNLDAIRKAMGLKTTKE